MVHSYVIISCYITIVFIDTFRKVRHDEFNHIYDLCR